MNKIVSIFQRILRIVMFIVAVAMLFGALFLLGIHQTNKSLEKTAVSGKIIYGTDVKAIHEVSYKYDGKEYQKRPLDVYFRTGPGLCCSGSSDTNFHFKDRATTNRFCRINWRLESGFTLDFIWRTSTFAKNENTGRKCK